MKLVVLWNGQSLGLTAINRQYRQLALRNHAWNSIGQHDIVSHYASRPCGTAGLSRLVPACAHSNIREVHCSTGQHSVCIHKSALALQTICSDRNIINNTLRYLLSLKRDLLRKRKSKKYAAIQRVDEVTFTLQYDETGDYILLPPSTPQETKSHYIRAYKCWTSALYKPYIGIISLETDNNIMLKSALYQHYIKIMNAVPSCIFVRKLWYSFVHYKRNNCSI